MRIKDAINRILYSDRNKDDIVLVIRDRIKGSAVIPFSQIERVDKYYVYLKNGETVIPLHRVIEIRDKGVVVWKR